MDEQKSTIELTATRLGCDGPHEISWAAPAETPIGMVYNKNPYAVMMATPQDLHDFAIGYSVSEGVINQASEITDITVLPVQNGIELHMTILEKRMARLNLHQTRRAHYGRAGCGLCGIDRLGDAIRPLPILPDPAQYLNAARAATAASALADAQPLRQKNKSVHGAAWVDQNGALMLVREDIGRHNALDKLIGACARAQTGFEHGFALLSSRCTYELVQKCAFAGINALLTLSAPSASAIDTARQANIALAALARKNGDLVVFTGTVWA